MVVDRRRFLGAVGVGAGLLMTEGVARAAESDGGHGRAEIRAYLGTYTSWAGGGTGLGLGAYDPATGRLRVTGVVPDVPNPSFVIDAGRWVYAANEKSDGEVTALAVGPDGVPKVLGSRSTGGADPCHLALHRGFLLSANYSSGSVAVHPVLPDGGLGERTDLVVHKGAGPDPDRQEGPHAHQVLADPTGEFVLAVDLGTDSVHSYRLSGEGKLTPATTARVHAGAGPRHLAFHPSGKHAYIANELDSTIVVAGYDRGVLTPGQKVSTLPAGAPTAPRNYPAEIVVSSDGRFAYLSNRGHDSVAVFAVERGGAALRLVEATPVGGKFPRHITLDASGRFLLAANQNSDNITTFEVDRTTGKLRLTSTTAAPIPVCVALKR
ncbi:6-phosphogluconolactonase [Saccharothrix texasensis]|uniref:6-phosphogluconolactonase n=2 Tax=Saccharothrix texasensis TaxID=103734 RepID=A0A3N1H4E2_9PSEU|nr:6-phosphogluconolactonase [Saccharothrix texasensis]